jgi:4-amino-4-deoxy-L-arabinose transferase-like glycosyltransferase
VTPERGAKGAAAKWVLLAIGLALFQVTVFPSARWVEDESWYSIPAHTYLVEGTLRNPTFAHTDLESKADVRPPAMPLALSLSFALFGTNPVAARVPSILASVAIVLLTFLIGRDLLGPAGGMVAAALVATDNFLVISGRTARPESLVTACCLLAVWLYLLTRHHNRGVLHLLSGLAAGLSVNFHVIGLPVVAGIGALYLWQGGGLRALARPGAWLFALGFVATLIPFAVRVSADPVKREAFHEMYGRGERTTWGEKIAKERNRYADFVGVGSVRFPLLGKFPVRLTVALILLGALGTLFFLKRDIFVVLVLLTAPHLLFWIYLVNGTSRYFTLVAPLFAMLMAGAWMYSHGRLALVGVVLLGVTQLAGNLLLLRSFRNADYSGLGARLQALIPPNESVYGAITFWMALHDRTYYCYDRTDAQYAEEQFRPSYVIFNDRVMVRGSGYGSDSHAELRSKLGDWIRRSGTLAGKVPDPFYGKLEVYRMTYR